MEDEDFTAGMSVLILLALIIAIPTAIFLLGWFSRGWFM